MQSERTNERKQDETVQMNANNVTKWIIEWIELINVYSGMVFILFFPSRAS